MHHHHNPILVLISIAVAIFASYTSLHLADRLRAASGWPRLAWLGTAAIALGGGIWAMHFVAMLAFRLQGTEVTYDPAMTLVSLLLPIAVTAFGFAMVAHRPDPPRILISGFVMGIGIVTMHYAGMAAIRFDGSLHHDPFWVAVSVVVALVAATAALWLALQNPTNAQRWIAALVMGLAISGMHYSAMMGTSFVVTGPARSSGDLAVGQASLAVAVVVSTLLILVLALAASFVDRHIANNTERQRTALWDSEQRFKLLVQSVRDYAIFMLDPKGHVSNWNAGAQRIKGYTRDEAMGQHFSIFYTERDRALNLPATALATAAAEGRFAAEGRRVRKDGTEFWASVVIEPVRDERGELVGFAKVTRDITEAKEAREKLEQTRDQLAQAQKMEAIGQLTGGLAHDFNNLLMIVIGNLDRVETLLQNGETGERLRRAVDNARQGAQRGSKLIASLLAFSRRQPLDPRVIDVDQVIKEVSPLLTRALGESRQLSIVGTENAWNIEVDVAQLEAALLNLAINARDAMPDGGRLVLEAKNIAINAADPHHPGVPSGRYCVISVSDTGSGMSEEILARAFEPFFTTKPAGQGTGLGLSQVYGFVKQSNGYVAIHSNVGAGTRIDLYFRRADAPLDRSTMTVSQNPPTGGGKSVLVAEDDEYVREFVAETLQGLHYNVVSFESGEKAIEHLRKSDNIDIIVTDVIMPGITGRQLADTARAIDPQIKVLFMTGYSRDAIVHDGRLDEDVVLLQKPFSREELANKLSSLCSSQS